MAPGGMSRFCDDCGYQACLRANCCLERTALAVGVEVQDLEHDVAIFADLVRNSKLPLFPVIAEGSRISPLSAADLEALDRELAERPARPLPAFRSGGADE